MSVAGPGLGKVSFGVGEEVTGDAVGGWSTADTIRPRTAPGQAWGWGHGEEGCPGDSQQIRISETSMTAQRWWLPWVVQGWWQVHHGSLKNRMKV